ncbi:hypothetical protein NDU88_003142 [Pleurodeles waltl]|uniref:Uncharacterized protein n=1 Tax=Pleurodeles waltl TaxID=8319 RepID=A0AAV7VGI5_PLEWA|nr:hypothetical protein NDU88_003142 [Pleurodeles waltl]
MIARAAGVPEQVWLLESRPKREKRGPGAGRCGGRPCRPGASEKLYRPLTAEEPRETGPHRAAGGRGKESGRGPERDWGRPAGAPGRC